MGNAEVLIEIEAKRTQVNEIEEEIRQLENQLEEEE